MQQQPIPEIKLKTVDGPQGFIVTTPDAFLTKDQKKAEQARRRAEFGEVRLAIDEAEHRRRVDYMLSLGLPSLTLLTDVCKKQRIAIVGSAPSLKDSIPYLKTFKGKIVAVNAAHDELLKHGIKPTFGILLDPREWVKTYQTPTPGVIYLVGSTVHPKVWERFLQAGIRPFTFVPIMTDENEELEEQYSDEMCFVAGATTVMLRGFNILMHLGASVGEAHAIDSCYPPGADGADPKALYAHAKPNIQTDVVEKTVECRATGDKFTYRANGAMDRQVKGFMSFVRDLPNHMVNGRTGKFRLVIAGDGVIPWMAWKDGGPDHYVEHLNPEAMAAKYGTAKHWNYYLDKPMENAA